MNQHEPRRYRRLVAPAGLVAFEVAVGETDLMVLAERELPDQARAAAREARRKIESHGALTPDFLSSRTPLPAPENVPAIVAAMYRGASVAGTGPMAAVAGAVAEHVARALAEHSAEVIVENGGDIFMISGEERRVAVAAPGSPMDGRLAIAVPAGERALCTSSGTVGHSASAGRADAVVVAAPTGAIADALATATANRVSDPSDAEAAVEWARERDDLQHVLVICGDTVAAWGQFDLTSATTTAGTVRPPRRSPADEEE
jgi:hypothetical protein